MCRSPQPRTAQSLKDVLGCAFGSSPVLFRASPTNPAASFPNLRPSDVQILAWQGDKSGKFLGDDSQLGVPSTPVSVSVSCGHSLGMNPPDVEPWCYMASWLGKARAKGPPRNHALNLGWPKEACSRLLWSLLTATPDLNSSPQGIASTLGTPVLSCFVKRSV